MNNNHQLKRNQLRNKYFSIKISCLADKRRYQHDSHDSRADKRPNRHDRHADSQCLQSGQSVKNWYHVTYYKSDVLSLGGTERFVILIAFITT